MVRPAIGILCGECRHLRRNYTCAAFPRGIAKSVVMGNPHLEPIKGDRGIQFERRPETEPEPEFVDLWPTEGLDD